MFRINQLNQDEDRGRYKEVVDLLSQLTLVGNLSEDEFWNQWQVMNRSGLIKLLVVRDIGNAGGRIIGCGTLVIEPKLIHNCSNLGHIQDIVIDGNYRKKGLGKMLIDQLMKWAKDYNCYKVILNCNESNIEFYEKCGFNKRGAEMSCFFHD